MQFSPNSLEKLLALLTFAGGIVAWYRTAVIAETNARRDANHLIRNQETLIKNLDTLFRENDKTLEEIKLEILEIRSFLYGRLNRRKEDE